MVRTKRKRRAAQQQQDFAKKKKKLGKKARPDNFTNTTLHTRQIHVPNQTRATNDVILREDKQLALTGLTLTELLGRTSHHNVNTRVSALNALNNAVCNQTAVAHAALQTRMAAPAGAAGACLSDDAAAVRTAAATLLMTVLSHLVDPTSLLPATCAHILAALTHIRRDVRIHAARLLPTLFQIPTIEAKLLFPSPNSLLLTLSDLLRSAENARQKTDVLRAVCACLGGNRSTSKMQMILPQTKWQRESNTSFYYHATPPRDGTRHGALLQCMSASDVQTLLRRVCNALTDALPSNEGTMDVHGTVVPAAVDALRAIVSPCAGLLSNVEDKDSGKDQKDREDQKQDEEAEDQNAIISTVPQSVLRMLEDCAKKMEMAPVTGVCGGLADVALNVRQPVLSVKFVEQALTRNSLTMGKDAVVRLLRAAVKDSKVAPHARVLAFAATGRFTEAVHQRNARTARAWIEGVREAAHLAGMYDFDAMQRTLMGKSVVPANIALGASIGTDALNEAVDFAVDVFDAFAGRNAIASMKYGLFGRHVLYQVVEVEKNSAASGVAIDERRARRVARMATVARLLANDTVAMAVMAGLAVRGGRSCLAVALLDAIEWALCTAPGIYGSDLGIRAVALVRMARQVMAEDGSAEELRQQLARIEMNS